MKDLIRMNQLAGLITESQARKMMAVLNEDNLEVKNIAKQIYSFLTKSGVTTKLVAAVPGDYGKSIGGKLTGGGNEALVSYYDDSKTKQTVIEIHLAGEEKGVLEVEKKILSSFPNLEQYNRETPSGPGVFRVVFRVKEKTTAKGGLVGNTQN
jgi:hypothetical protein